MDKHPNSALFDRHPYLGVANRPGASKVLNNVKISHDSLGNRPSKYPITESVFRIVTIGGSTTYGVGVNDHENWPYLLDSITGRDTSVVNLSVPGYSTVEHLVTAALYLQKFMPDVIIIHSGLNDLRISNVKNFNIDHSGFHYPHLIGSMGQCYLEKIPKVSTLYYSIRFLQKVKLFPVCAYHQARVYGTGNFGLDPVAIADYENKLERLIRICDDQSDRIILVPQVLIEENIINNELRWWIPFIKPENLLDVVHTYNRVMQKLGERHDVVFLDEMERVRWRSEDFTDPSHLNAESNLKLAKLIKKALATRDSVSEDVSPSSSR